MTKLAYFFIFIQLNARDFFKQSIRWQNWTFFFKANILKQFKGFEINK